MKPSLGRLLIMGSLFTVACGEAAEEHAAPPAAEIRGRSMVVQQVPRTAVLEAAGTAEPWASATLSTKLMGSVRSVEVREGDRVRSGQVLVRIDSRDLEAKDAQVAAGITEAEAHLEQARTHAERMRALFADEAAPKAQLEAAETGFAAAEARVRAAHAAGAELEALHSYSLVRAPFNAIVTARMVDPGAFAAPGAPLVTVQDVSRLRISVTVAPVAVREVQRGDSVLATIEGTTTAAQVEGVVPAQGGNLYTVNAALDNPDGRFLAGSAATLKLPQGERTTIVVPNDAVVRRGDMTGVYVVGPNGPELRWVRLGPAMADSAEVLSGLRDGERVIASPTTEQEG